MKILHIVGGSFEDGAFKGASILHNSLKEFGVKSKILNNNIKNKIYTENKLSEDILFIQDSHFKRVLKYLKITFEKILKTIFLPTPRSTFTFGFFGEDLTFTELDINYLDVNFLEDMLNVLDALEVQEEEDQLQQATGIKIAGTAIGQDTETQITTIVTGQIVSLRRSVSDSARIDIDGSGSYTVIFIQDGKSNIVRVNGGSDSTIKITQSN